MRKRTPRQENGRNNGFFNRQRLQVLRRNPHFFGFLARGCDGLSGMGKALHCCGSMRKVSCLTLTGNVLIFMEQQFATLSPVESSN